MPEECAKAVFAEYFGALLVDVGAALERIVAECKSITLNGERERIAANFSERTITHRGSGMTGYNSVTFPLNRCLAA